MRAGFGVPELDDALGGGLERGTVVVLSSTHHDRVLAMGQAFLLEGLARREGGIVVTDRPPADVRDALHALDPHVEAYEREGALRYVSPADDEAVQLPSEDVEASWDLNALTATFDRERQAVGDRSRVRIEVEAGTRLLSRGPADRVRRFLRVLVERSREAAATALLVVDPSLLSPDVAEELSELADGWLELRIDDQTELLGWRTDSV